MPSIMDIKIKIIFLIPQINIFYTQLNKVLLLIVKWGWIYNMPDDNMKWLI
jgi:hypothetical protein